MTDETKASEINLLQTTDARVWAREFMRTVKDYAVTIDEDLMVAWFANMWAATHDPLNNRIAELERELNAMRQEDE